MNKIIAKENLAENVVSLKVEAPLIANKVQAGQFVILRVDKKGERIPLTVVSKDDLKSVLHLIFQVVGKTTEKLSRLKIGDHIEDLVGPLGKPTKIKHYGHIVIVGGGVGVAEAYPVTKAFKTAGNKISVIIGARTENLLILEEELRSICDILYVCTDDGSKGHKGFVTDVLKDILEKKESTNLVYSIGPLIMMKNVTEMTRPYKIPTLVCLNPIMVDGTGMCGSCRVTVGGKTRFACVDGPEFDAHEVDFAELAARLGSYLEKEKLALEHYLNEVR
jgi:ferredoxin--NADP+ reductase